LIVKKSWANHFDKYPVAVIVVVASVCFPAFAVGIVVIYFLVLLPFFQ